MIRQKYTFLLAAFLLAAFLLAVPSVTSFAQNQPFTRQDTLRGSITPERAWWDLTYYHLNIRVNPADSTVRGVNTVQYKVLEPSQRMQIDLQPPMRIDKAEQNGKQLSISRDGNVYYIELAEQQQAGASYKLDIHFGGKPQVSERPPWSGGLTWKKDANGNPFVATTSQEVGASLWWPCKDHMYDEPDSMRISVTVPATLTGVANGRLRGTNTNNDNTKTFHWVVSNPISNYVVNVNVADYAHFSEKYQGEKGQLDCDYYVLRYNLPKAQKQFKQVAPMLKAFEHWFGPYPFYEDSYKLVEVPYLGMEHQSSVTYGNGYQNGYLGHDLSGTGWGLKFDYIIIHETGHEWFANNITYKDIADMWIHESFTTYSENLYLDYHHGKEAASAYVIGLRGNIQNDKPIIGQYDVNHKGSGDMYPKGANMLHTLRQIVNDDEKWRSILRGLNKDFYHQTVTSKQIEDYLSKHTNRDLSTFFNQYLRDTRLPRLEYQLQGTTLKYRWTKVVEGFNMPVRVLLDGKEKWLEPTSTWQELKGLKKNTSIKADPNFYIESAAVTAS